MAAQQHGEHHDEHRLDVSSVSVMLILLIAFTLTSEKLLTSHAASSCQAESLMKNDTFTFIPILFKAFLKGKP